LDIDYISLLVIVVLVIREKILQEAEGLVKVIDQSIQSINGSFIFLNIEKKAEHNGCSTTLKVPYYNNET